MEQFQIEIRLGFPRRKTEFLPSFEKQIPFSEYIKLDEDVDYLFIRYLFQAFDETEAEVDLPFLLVEKLGPEEHLFLGLDVLHFFFIIEGLYKKVAFRPIDIVRLLEIDGVLEEGIGLVCLLLNVDFEVSPQFDEFAELFEI